MLRSMILASAMICCGAALAAAAPVVDISSSSTTPNGSVTLGVSVSDTSADPIFGFGLDFVVTPQAGATGTLSFQNPGATDANPLFFPGFPLANGGTQEVGPPTPNLYVTNGALTGVVAPSAGIEMLNLHLTASSNASGVFNVSVFQSPGSLFDGKLSDADNQAISTTFNPGTVTISVPEPGSLMLALTGLAGLAAYLGFRRRSAA